MNTQDHTSTPSTASPQTDGTNEKKPRRTWRGFFRDLFAYLVIYVLISGISIGPLFWYWFGAVYADGPKWIARIYIPLLLLCQVFPPLDWLINWWVNWWIH